MRRVMGKRLYSLDHAVTTFTSDARSTGWENASMWYQISVHAAEFDVGVPKPCSRILMNAQLPCAVLILISLVPTLRSRMT